MFKRFWNLISGGSTVWSVLPSSWQAAVTTALSAVTAYAGYQWGGLYWALLGAAAMFAFGMSAAYYAILLKQLTNIFERVTVEAIVPVQAMIQGNKEKKEFLIRGLTIELHLRNHSQRTTYFKMKRVNHSMAEQTMKGSSKIDDLSISIVPPNTVQKIVLATLPDIRITDDSLVGNIDLEMLYGPSKDNLCYLFQYISEPILGVFIDLETGKSQISLSCPIKKHLHQRI